MKNVFVTGGAGYIGSHTCLALLEQSYNVTVFDNLSNSSDESLTRVQSITGKNLAFIEGDIRDSKALLSALKQSKADAVIHFAGLKAVGESVEKPLEYYDNNINGTLVLLQCMKALGLRQLVFSSSATVYGVPQYLPLDEKHPLSATNPYGRSKLIIEDMLRDLCVSDSSWHVAILRYFNPVGAHISGRIGEDPSGVPNNLMPYISQVAVGLRPYLQVFGNDYETVDGTGVRDYIHVVDLAAGHLKALQYLNQHQKGITVNLGTGRGYSVIEMANAFSQASGQPVPYQFSPRRAGDVAACYADPGFAQQELGWCAEKSLDEMCVDTWRWQSNNPNGYRIV